MTVISRRALLLGGLAGFGAVAAAGGAGVVLVEEDVLPGKVRLDKAIGRCGVAPAPPAAAGVVRRDTLHSRKRSADVTVVTALPAGHDSVRGLPVVVALHGAFGSAASVLHGLAMDHYLTDAVARGATRPYAIVAADGGPDGYWHPRRSGDDPLGMLTGELLPWLDERGAGTSRIGVMGWSMGGYGALLLAETLGRSKVAAVVATSPAVFASYGNARAANRLAFDDQADFTRNDVMSRLGGLAGIPAWVDCGTSDPFAPMARRLRDRLRPEGGMSGGCHDNAFWRRRLPAQLAFMGRHLAATAPAGDAGAAGATGGFTPGSAERS